ncbi:MAG TPA: glycosyltransferase [Candidatus Methylomirabilis sp.]|nr:glycosyltransferase [Candidatus Methylomirabilis sp.]
MKIFLVLSNFPYKNGEAIEVVGYEVMRLMLAAGHHIDVQVLIRDHPNDFHAKKEAQIRAECRDLDGIDILPAIYLGRDEGRQSRWRKRLEYMITAVCSIPFIRRRPNPLLFPAMRARKEIDIAVRKMESDIILGIWSWESLAATHAIRGVPKFMYYGNPDHKPPEARLEHPQLYDIPVDGVKGALNLRLLKMINRARELQHLRMMRRCEVTANNSLIDAQYYKDAGHPRSLYLQNMWPEADGGPLFGGDCADNGPVKVIGSVGNLGATGNTFGLHFLGHQLAPRLERIFGESSIEVDVYGGGKPSKAVASVLNRPSIRMRGWVKDIAAEIKNSCAFLVLTNVGGFIVGNTRILLAWSLGTCVIAHTNSALSMPEIKHMENALLGNDADEIAHLIEMAARDKGLRERIGRGGYETFQKYYRSDKVVPMMLQSMQQCVDEYCAAGLKN